MVVDMGQSTLGYQVKADVHTQFPELGPADGSRD